MLHVDQSDDDDDDDDRCGGGKKTEDIKRKFPRPTM